MRAHFEKETKNSLLPSPSWLALIKDSERQQKHNTISRLKGSGNTHNKHTAAHSWLSCSKQTSGTAIPQIQY